MIQAKFICKKCQHKTNIKIASNGCPSCGNNLFRVAWNRGIPTMENPLKDPYRRKEKPGDGEGPKLTEVGNSDLDGEAGSGLGSNRRGKEGPKGTSSDSDGEEGKELPSEPVLMDEHRNDGNYVAQQERLLDLGSGTDGIKQDILNPTPEPIGPHNMQGGVKPRNPSGSFADIFTKVIQRRRL